MNNLKYETQKQPKIRTPINRLKKESNKSRKRRLLKKSKIKQSEYYSSDKIKRSSNIYAIPMDSLLSNHWEELWLELKKISKSKIYIT